MNTTHTRTSETAAFDRSRELFLDEMLDETQVEREYGLKVGFLRAKRLRGGGPEFTKAGRSVRYRRRAILNYLNANTRQSTTVADAADGARWRPFRNR